MKIAKPIIAVTIIFCSLLLSTIPCKSCAYDTKIKREYVRYCEEIGAKYCVCPELLMAIIEHESGGDPNAGLGWAKCYGLMGVSSKWNADRMRRLGVTNLYDPYSNILVATDLLAELFEKYDDPYEVLDYYGGWQHSAKGYKEVFKQLERAQELEIIHGKYNYMTVG